jgi:hypothetical protein
MCGLELSKWLRKKSDREQHGVRLATCERPPLGLSHTQNHLSGRPRVAEMLLLTSQQPSERSVGTEKVCVFITEYVFISVVPIIKLFVWEEGDSGGHVQRETTSRGLCGLVCPSRTSERMKKLCLLLPVCVFITAVPIIKLFARGEGDSGGYVLRETTSRGLCGLVCPSRTSERGGEGDCVKEGGGGEGERERERALGRWRLL